MQCCEKSSVQGRASPLQNSPCKSRHPCKRLSVLVRSRSSGIQCTVLRNAWNLVCTFRTGWHTRGCRITCGSWPIGAARWGRKRCTAWQRGTTNPSEGPGREQVDEVPKPNHYFGPHRATSLAISPAKRRLLRLVNRTYHHWHSRFSCPRAQDLCEFAPTPLSISPQPANPAFPPESNDP
jgi:hypothetical protein